jgi:hypothetical protein
VAEPRGTNIRQGSAPRQPIGARVAILPSSDPIIRPLFKRPWREKCRRWPSGRRNRSPRPSDFRHWRERAFERDLLVGIATSVHVIRIAADFPVTPRLNICCYDLRGDACHEPRNSPRLQQICATKRIVRITGSGGERGRR